MTISDRTDRLQQAIDLMQAGKTAEAAEMTHQLAQEGETDSPLLNLAGILQMQLGHMEKGITLLQQSLQQNPMQAQTLCNLGYGLEALGRLPEALDVLDRAIVQNPDYAKAHANRGNVLFGLKRYTEALAASDAALAITPGLMEAECNRANALRELGRLEEALQAVNAAIARAPQLALLYNNRGNILRELQEPEKALTDFDQAIAIAPNYADAHTNRGNVLRDIKRYDDARQSHDQAIALNPTSPSAYWNKALLELMTGNYAEGWALFERRWQSQSLKSKVRHFDPPAWQGEDIQGKTLLVYAEQGYGDTVQFCRYVPLLLAGGMDVVLEAPRTLLPLLATLPGNAEGHLHLVAQGDTLAPFDRHIALMSLPRIFGTEVNTIPRAVPYLSAPPARIERWQKQLGRKTGPRIGLVWSGRPGQAPDIKRSAQLTDIAPILSLPFEFHALQKDIRGEDAAQLGQWPQLNTHTDELGDFADTAALITQMDLTLSVDTSVAHVAGAIGAPVWLMLPWVAEWRWLTERSDSPWYPTAELVRQPALGDWSGLMNQIVTKLKQQF